MKIVLFLLSLSLLNANETKQCIVCHPKITALWQTSHHAKSMQRPTPKNVLGDFNNSSFVYLGKKSRFYTKDGKYFVHTEGEDGKLHTYKVAYTFGFTPLQQYLLQTKNGKLQALDIAWNVQKKRWFHLHADENITHSSPLHWSKMQLNWNYMCADCHSSGVKKNYDKTSKTYHTTFESVSVSCSECHGDASMHLKWTKKRTIANKGFLHPLKRENEVERCIKCHSRRYPLNDSYKAGNKVADHYRVATLDRVLYFDNGAIEDEVFVYGSFAQSKMFQNGVVCSDCHDLHSTQKPTQKVCAKCHEKKRYFSSRHHHHKAEYVTCIACHMPPRTYMKIDERNDHSFSIPNPFISQQDLKISNACNLCHSDKSALWSIQAMKRWGMSLRVDAFYKTAKAVREEKAGGFMILQSFLNAPNPAIQKATLLPYLGNYRTLESFQLAQKFLLSKDAMIQKGALKAMELFGVKEGDDLIFGMLDSPILDIRIEAAKYLAAYLGANISHSKRKKIQKVLLEYERVLSFNAERAESLLELALLEHYKMHDDKAEKLYKKALKVEPYLFSVYINYAHFLSGKFKHKEAIAILKQGLKKLPKSAWLYHALALEYINNNQKSKSLPLLKKAYELDKDSVRFGYVYAVALAEQNINKSIAILKELYTEHPGSHMVQNALQFYQTQRRKK